MSGNLMSLRLLKGLLMTYNRDHQEDRAVVRPADTIPNLR